MSAGIRSAFGTTSWDTIRRFPGELSDPPTDGYMR
jgi:hypothetical protein